jgi:hypothetical protein
MTSTGARVVSKTTRSALVIGVSCFALAEHSAPALANPWDT